MALRIAMVIDPWSLPFNGTVVSTRRFVFALKERGLDVRLLSIGSDPQIESVSFEQLSIPGVNGIIDSMRAPLARPDHRRIRQALEGCDLLHVQYPFFLGHAAITQARRMGIPVVCSFHVQPENILMNIGLSSPWLVRLLYRLFVARFFNRSDVVVVPSEFGARLLREQGVVKPIHVVSNGVPAGFFEVAPAEPNERRLRLLSIGRLAAEKQHEILMHAVANCAHAANIDLIIAGAGPQEHALRTLAATLKLSVTIRVVGYEEMLELLSAADLVVHTSTIELEGMPVLEAMAAGRTVVVSDSPDTACVGFVKEDRERFRVGDWQDLAGKIDYWLSHPGERARQGSANRAFALELSHQRSVDILESIYARLSAPVEEPMRETADGRGSEVR